MDAQNLLLASLTKSLSVPVAVINADVAEIVTCNSAFTRVMGVDDEEGVGEGVSLWSIFPEIDQQSLIKKIKAGKKFTFEAERKIGRKRITYGVSIDPAVLLDPSCWLLECSDITNEKKSACLLASYSELIEEKNRALHELAFTDQLTSVSNRRALFEDFPGIVSDNGGKRAVSLYAGY